MIGSAPVSRVVNRPTDKTKPLCRSVCAHFRFLVGLVCKSDLVYQTYIVDMVGLIIRRKMGLKNKVAHDFENFIMCICFNSSHLFFFCNPFAACFWSLSLRHFQNLFADWYVAITALSYSIWYLG